MPATTDRHRITVAWNVRFDNTCQPLSAPFTWPAFFWRCSGLILKDFRPSVTHGNTNVLIGVDTHKHVMPHASLKEQYNTNFGKTLFWNLVYCPLNRSQSLFYFLPQEKNITVKLARLGLSNVFRTSQTPGGKRSSFDKRRSWGQNEVNNKVWTQ